MNVSDFNSTRQERILYACEQMLKENWQCPVHPPCARSVSEVYFRAGFFDNSEHNIQLTYDEVQTYTTYSHTQAAKNMPGAVVFLDYTYDAVKPDGIGPEDTYTHVGIMKNSNQFYHFSSHGWTIGNLSEWHVHEFRIPKNDYIISVIKDDVINKFDTIKIFANPNAKGEMECNVLINGVKSVKAFVEMNIKFKK